MAQAIIGKPAGIRFAVGTAIFGNVQPADVALLAELGFPGIEPYRNNVMGYVERPQELKAILDNYGIAMCTCSNGGAGQSTDFIDPAARQQTIDDHVAFARLGRQRRGQKRGRQANRERVPSHYDRHS